MRIAISTLALPMSIFLASCSIPTLSHVPEKPIPVFRIHRWYRTQGAIFIQVYPDDRSLDKRTSYSYKASTKLEGQKILVRIGAVEGPTTGYNLITTEVSAPDGRDYAIIDEYSGKQMGQIESGKTEGVSTTN